MKPISLSIKGLNSFEDEQYIDFDKLTMNGFFGIFGPTGSGKSTILDGICLALYGDIPRGDVNFINLNSERTYVEFVFQISEAETKKYKVSREFKRNKKTDKVLSDKCKIVDITDDEPKILEDSVKLTTKKCEEIIGLKREDFLRTVVLPQGKFSEFLKLTGANRNQMLERLFNLSEYGEGLRGKLKNSTEIEKSSLNRIEGELSGIGAVEPADLQKQDDLVKSKKLENEQAAKECNLLEIKLKEQSEIFDLQNEKQSHLSNLEKLLINKPEIDNKAVSLVIYKNANQLKDMINDFEKTKLEFVDCNNKLSEIELKRKECSNERTDIESKYINAKKSYETELPILLESKGKYTEALEKIKELEGLKLKIEQLKVDEIELNKKLSKLNKDKEDKAKECFDLKKSIDEMTMLINDMKVNASFRANVESGYQLSKELIKENERKSKTVNVKDNLAKDYEVDRLSLKEINSKLSELKDKELLIENELSALKSKPTGNSEDLIKLNDRLNSATNAWKLFEGKSNRIEENTKDINKLSILKKELESNRDEQRAALEDYKMKLEKSKVENLALELRRSLKHGENCPVCGGLDHPYLHDDSVNLNEFSVDVVEFESKIKELSNLVSEQETKVNNLDTQLAVLAKQIESDKSEIGSLDKSLLEVSPSALKQEADNLATNIKEFERNKTDLEAKEKECLKEKASYESKQSAILSKLEGISSRLEIIEKELIEQSNNIKSTEDKIDRLKMDLKVDDFEFEYNKIFEMESKRETLEKQYSDNTKSLTTIEALLKDIENEINLGSNELTSILTRKDSLSANYTQQIETLSSKVGELDLVAKVLSDTDSKITYIQSSFKDLENLKVVVDNKYNLLNEEFIKEEQRKIGLDSRIKSSEVNLQHKLTELNFDNIESVKSNFKDQVDIDNIESAIKEFETNIANLNSLIKSLEVKLGDRVVDEDEFKQLGQALKDKQLELSVINKSYILECKKLEDLKIKLESIKEILERKNKVEKKLAILNELNNLFIGNKFVEFVATERLKYVSREASTRLLDITGGAYSIETDDNAMFLIKDNKNGGVLREPSTLSGGETFLASLALALALSAEIQLKGTAPLELFFLDEGFGTLDDNLLEVLMSSLEKIHNDKLKIGLISHVESVKQRVPVKLIVTPAKSGICGSTIKIEHN